jgi:hypothetical protein
MPAINRGLGDPEVLFALVEFLAAQGARPHQPQAPLEVGPGAVARVASLVLRAAVRHPAGEVTDSRNALARDAGPMAT